MSAPAAQAPVRAPRPPNEWMLFRSHFCRLYKLRDDRDPHLNGKGLSGLASALWATYSPEEKKQWQVRAKEASEMHAAFFPNYKYQPRRKGEEKEKKQRGRKPKESRGLRFVPYARLSSERSEVVSEPMLPAIFDLSGVPPITGPSPSAIDTVYPLPHAQPNAPIMFPLYSTQAPAPAPTQAYQPWNSGSAQAATFWTPTSYEQFQGPYDLTETGSAPQLPSPSRSPHLSDRSSQDDDYSNIVPSIDVLDQFLQNHPEDQGDIDMTPTQPIVENMWDFVNLDGFRSV